jgi:hypothetical protein
MHTLYSIKPLTVETQTLRDLGVLRYQIGQQAIRAVNEHLLSQYDKRKFDSKSTRATYVQTLISDTQFPFIWESFRPGNIPVGGAKLCYDDVSKIYNISRLVVSLACSQKRRGRFQSVPVLRAFGVYWTAYGIRMPIVPSDPGQGSRPIGVLAMASAAVSSMVIWQSQYPGSEAL